MNQPTRLFELLPYQLEKFNLDVCLADKKNGQWQKFSTQDVINICNELSYGLLAQGIEAGQKVAIISENRTEWNFADQAIQQIGGIGVPMYPTISSDDYAYIFEHSETRLVFVSNADIYARAKEGADKAGLDLPIYSFDEIEGVAHWKTLLTEATAEAEAEVVKRKEVVKPDDMVTIIYTSGTTGRPKGVMLSHTNIMSNSRAVAQRAAYDNGKDRVLSFLPLCHIFERTAIYFYFQLGLSVYYAESLETISANLQEIKPHGFNTVPRLIEKVYDKIMEKGYALSGVKKSLFFWAVNMGLPYVPEEPSGFKLKIARKLIFSKWQEALGGNIKHIIVGASAIQPRLKKVFWAADIKIIEGYGLTETSPGVCIGMHEADKAKLDYVGPLLEGVQVKIAEDGEVLVKGPNVMMGYYKDEAKTNEVIQDGWFHTGDIGELSGNYLRITDRKKEMFKTSGGKYIAPQVIENKLKESIMIEQAMVVGESRKFPSALLVLNMEAVHAWCERHGVNADDPALFQNDKLLAKVDAEVEEANTNFGQWEKVKKHAIMPEAWGIETGELTPTLKLKRRVIKQKYGDYIEKLYDLS